MRILSIAGQNIASLADPFAIDLTAPPLLGAGLFAITGETGAGKSSILDAMCLALYGEAPRLALGSGDDDVPDAGDEAIKARDPRAILRRGAASGWAEVRFAGADGAEYVARWQARRARDRAEGKLQKVGRMVARADGQVLATQADDTRAVVETLTGLSWPEFRRTVLLAQGEVDAFLRADTNDRARLLEKITGTGIYRAVSVAVHDRELAARTALDALRLRRDEHRALDDTAIAALAAERASLLSETATARQVRAGLAADMERHRRLDEAARLADDAARTLAAAVAAQADGGGDRSLLARLDRAEPLRSAWDAARAAAADERKARDQAATRLAALQAAQQAAAMATADATRTSDALAACEDAFKSLAPQWDRAAELDARIAAAVRETAAAVARAAGDGRSADRAAALAAQTGAALAHARTRLAAAETALARLQVEAALADDWPRIADDLGNHASATATLAAALGQAATADAAIRDLEQALAQLDAAAAQDETARVAVSAGAADLDARIAAESGEAPEQRMVVLTDLSAVLAELARLHRAALAAAADLAAALAAKAKADQAATEAGHDIGLSRRALEAAESAAAALSAPAERATLALSEQARHLRTRLEPGQPCPVCGAADHPVADAALRAVAESLRADLARARSQAADARNGLTAAEGRLAAARAQAGAAATAATRAAQELALAEQGWASSRDRASGLGTPLPLPAEHRLAGPALADAQARTETALAQARAALDRLSDLRRQRTDVQNRLADLTQATTRRDRDRLELRTRLAEARQALALARQSAGTAAASLASLNGRLGPLLDAAGETADDGTAARLAPRMAALRAARAEQAGAADNVAACAPAAEAATLRAAAARENADAAAAVLAVRQAEEDALRRDRATLLGGTPTDVHRSRTNAARLAAQTAERAAAAACAQAQAQAAAAQAAATAAQDSAASAKATMARTDMALAAALDAAGLDPAALDAALSADGARRETLRARLRALDDGVTAARAAVSGRQADLHALRAAGTPDLPADDTLAALSALDAVQQLRTERIGAVSEQLAADTATRALLAGLDADIATARGDLDIWQAVDAAIGSRTGDRFARIAQELTLDGLVARANGHLADLNPRYRLQRAAGLSLLVRDGDMGDELRATRSLSGGERFLCSLALALALSRTGARGGLAATLFIDEGFGSLDAASLDIALDALERLQSQGRQVGVISHVEAMQDRIAVRIRVERQGGGRSRVRVEGPAP